MILVARIGDVGDAADDPEAVRSALTAAHMRVSLGGRAPRRPRRPADEGETLAAFGLGAVAGNEVEPRDPRAIELAADDESGRRVRGSRSASRRARCCRTPSRVAVSLCPGDPSREARELARAAAAGEVAAASDVASQVSARYSVTA